MEIGEQLQMLIRTRFTACHYQAANEAHV